VVVLIARTSALAALLSLLPVPASPAPAQAPAAAAGFGAIRGTVDVRRPAAAPQPRPHAGDLGAHAAPAAPDRTRTVVYLDPAPQGAFEDPERARATLDQVGEAFVPYVLAVRAGTEVDFPNRDRTYHNVFSLSKPKRFDLGRYATGQSKSVRFDRPGVVRVFCDIHSHMSAFVLVFAHRYFATTDGAGRYRLERVPAGTYTVAAWNDGRVRETRQVTVADGNTVQLDWVIP
jgi:plastocyanin